MKDGLLLATADIDQEAKGIASTGARVGEDVGVSSIEGIVELKIGKVTILKVPGIKRGGSRMVDIEQLKTKISDSKLVGAIGIEAVVTLRKLGISNVYLYGVTEAAIEAAKTGLCPVIACVDDEIPGLTRKLGEEDIDYEIIDMKKG
jgi:putative transcriptional regulator